MAPIYSTYVDVWCVHLFLGGGLSDEPPNWNCEFYQSYALCDGRDAQRNVGTKGVFTFLDMFLGFMGIYYGMHLACNSKVQKAFRLRVNASGIYNFAVLKKTSGLA